jgi:hypothetical protein
LATVMNRVHQQLAPEKIANTPEFAVCVSYLLIPVFTFELRNPFSRLKMHYAKCRHEFV